ncbi:Uncharacterised protein [Chlamydia trachomatis]|nr:Uncharacterised protein [Chlamydia trachomatis]
MNELNEKFHAASQDLYGQAGAQQGGPQPGGQGFQGGNPGAGGAQNGGQPTGAEDVPYEEV